MASKPTISLLAAALVVAAPVAYAGTAATEAPAATSPQPAKVAPKRAVMHLWRDEASAGYVAPARITAFNDVLVPLDKAVATADKAIGGQAIDVDFRHQGERLVYRMHILKANTATPVIVDAMSGKIVHEGRAIPLRDFDRKDRTEMAALKGASTSLAKAAEAAASHAGGKAMAATLESAHGSLNYEIAVVKDGKVQRLKVNSANGQIA